MRRGGQEQTPPKEEEKYFINEEITALKVRLVDVEGNQVGIVGRDEALRMAEDSGVDLVQVAANAEPPVCRLLDYGKLKYKEQKKASEARKKSSTHGIKELRLRYSTDAHDLETKMRNARRFLIEGDKVKFQMRFKGREELYKDLGEGIFVKIQETLADVAQVDELTPLIGRKMHLLLSPKAGGGSPKPAPKN